jgi:hypothetical protein
VWAIQAIIVLQPASMITAIINRLCAQVVVEMPVIANVHTIAKLMTME